MYLLTVENNIGKVITDIFDDIDKGIIDVLTPIIDVSLVIAGIACVILIARHILPAIENSEPIDIYPLLKPILIAIVILNFDTVVIGSLNGALGAINNEVKEVFDAGDGGASNFHDLATKKKEEVYKEHKPAESKSIVAGWVQKITNAPKYIGIWLKYDFFFVGLYNIATFLGTLLYLGLLLVSRFYLIILAIVGPLTLAFSQYSFFSGSMGSWLGKYISVGLWPAIANILRYMLNEISIIMGQGVGTGWDEGLVMFFLIIGLSFLYLQVPQISEYICAAGGMGALQRGVNKAVSNTTKVATGAAMGGAAVAAGAASAYKEGIFDTNIAEKAHGLATSFSDRTGARGMTSRAGEQLGAWMGSKARGWKDSTTAMQRGETAEQRATRVAERMKAKQELWEERHAPKKKDLRKNAKRIQNQMRRGRYVSQENIELVQRYKEGEYKGRGKYRPTPVEKSPNYFKNTTSFILSGLDNKYTPPAGWHPPMANNNGADLGGGNTKTGSKGFKK